MTAALEGGDWSATRPGRTLLPGKTRYPLYRRLGGPQGRSGRAENLAPPAFGPRTIQPLVGRHGSYVQQLFQCSVLTGWILYSRWCVYYGVRTESLNIIQVNVCLQMVNPMS
jgi:hypothetical protein